MSSTQTPFDICQSLSDRLSLNPLMLYQPSSDQSEMFQDTVQFLVLCRRLAAKQNKIFSAVEQLISLIELIAQFNFFNRILLAVLTQVLFVTFFNLSVFHFKV